jgi:hypothetical protein
MESRHQLQALSDSLFAMMAAIISGGNLVTTLRLNDGT